MIRHQLCEKSTSTGAIRVVDRYHSLGGGREKKEILEQMTPRGSASISNFACHGWDQSVCDSKEEMKRQIINREGRREETAYLWITLTSCPREKVAAEADTVVCGDERLLRRWAESHNA